MEQGSANKSGEDSLAHAAGEQSTDARRDNLSLPGPSGQAQKEETEFLGPAATRYIVQLHNRRFQCGFCEVTFLRKFDCKQHMLKKHGEVLFAASQISSIQTHLQGLEKLGAAMEWIREEIVANDVDEGHATRGDSLILQVRFEGGVAEALLQGVQAADESSRYMGVDANEDSTPRVETSQAVACPESVPDKFVHPSIDDDNVEAAGENYDKGEVLQNLPSCSTYDYIQHRELEGVKLPDEPTYADIEQIVEYNEADE